MSDADEAGKKDVPLSLSVPAADKQAVLAWMKQHDVRSLSYAVRCMMRFALAHGVKPDAETDLRKTRRERARAKE